MNSGATVLAQSTLEPSNTHSQIAASQVLDNTITAKASALPDTDTDTNDHEDNGDSDDGDFVFDEALFNTKRTQVTQLKQLSVNPETTAGTYRVDVYLNQKFLLQKAIQFIPSQASVIPCLDAELVKLAELIINPKLDFGPAPQCFSLEELISTGRSHFDFSQMRLDLSIPDSKIKRLPQGHIPKSEWQAGDTIGFINYTANYFQHHYTTEQLNNRSESGFVFLQGGINLGTWQYRQQASINMNNKKAEWQTLNQYLKKPLPAINSELAIGQLSSAGRFFSGMRYEGIRLNSDDRMLSPVLRNYAPVIQGIAKTQAKVTISQYGRIIYQSTVAAGAFEIKDLSAVQGDGELHVLVEEADLSQHSFVVPYSANNTTLRKGSYQYHLDLGQSRDAAQAQYFANLSGQYGLTNIQGLSAGLSLAHQYQAIILGHQLSHAWGIFNTDFSLSYTALDDAIPQQRPQHSQSSVGWLLSGQYSRYLTAQRRSILIHLLYFPKSRYRTLSEHVRFQDSRADLAIAPSTVLDPSDQVSDLNAQPHAEQIRLRMSINQSLGKYGNAYLTTALQKFRDHRSNTYQFQLGYSTNLSDQLSLNINLSQSKNSSSSAPTISAASEFSSSRLFQQSTSSDFSAAISVTFATNSRLYRPNQYNLSHLYTQNSSSTQLGLSGKLDEAASLTYQLGAYSQSNSQDYSWSAALQKQSSKFNIDINSMLGSGFWQASLGAQGAVALHTGGVTFGSFLSDTFALIEAPGAAGAELLNSKDAVINSRGYALLPAINPYQHNTITLNPLGMAQHIELENGTQRVVPYAGASLKIKFNSRQGYALLIQSQLSDGSYVPFGTEVFDITNQSTTANPEESIGMVGQQGQIYLRARHQQGRLALRWATHTQHACHIDYALSANQLKAALIRLSAPCQMTLE